MTPEATQPMPVPAELAEPRAGRAPVPVWLFLLLFVLLYWALVSFDFHGGWFDPVVYAPYRSAQEVAFMWPPKGDLEVLLARGKEVFHVNCAVCHMDNGVGNPANGCPPLVGSEWVTSPGPGRMIRIESKGLIGPIEVGGKPYGTGGQSMLPVGDQLQGDEKQKAYDIAAIVTYVRKTFGNIPTIVKPEQVAAVRAQIKDRNTPFTADELKKVPENE